jgi:autotransporter-associated beta strand protein
MSSRRASFAFRSGGCIASVIVVFLQNVYAGTSLQFNTSGTPANPIIGPANAVWNTTTGDYWSNGTADIPWVNGDTADFNFTNALASANITINDPSNTVDVAGMTMETTNSNYTVTVLPENSSSSLTLTSPTIGIENRAEMTIGASIAGTVGLTLNTLGGPAGEPNLVLAAPATYTGPTNINDGVLVLADSLTGGADGSLGNTAITVGGSGILTAAGANRTVGSNGPGTAGAILDVQGQLNTVYDSLTVNQENGFSGNGLVFQDADLEFGIGPPGQNTELVDDGPGTASVISGAGIHIFITGNSPSGTYTLISDPAGGLLSPDIHLSNGQGTETIGSGNQDFLVTLNDSNTAVSINVQPTTGGGTPEPACVALFAGAGSFFLLRRRTSRR